MTMEAELPDGRVLEFPDGTDPAIIQSTVKRVLGVSDGGVGDGGIAGGDNLAPVVEPSFLESLAGQAGDVAIGALKAKQAGGEILASAAAGAIAEPIAGIAGLGAEGLGALGLDVPSGAEVVRGIQDFTTKAFQPSGQTAQAAGKAIGEAAEFVGEEVIEPLGLDDLGGKTLEATGSPALATLVDTLPTILSEVVPAGFAARQSVRIGKASRKLIADEVAKGNPNIDLVTKALNERGEVVTAPASKAALKVISKEVGEDRGKAAISVLENMSPASKRQFNKQLDIVERGSKDPIFKDSNRPMDVVGDAIGNRARAIAVKNKSAGEKIGKIAQTLKAESVDISAPIREFENKLREMGVTFSVANDGWVTPDFSRSKFIGGSQKDMAVLVNDLLNDTPDFQSAHKLKRQIRDNVDFDAGGTSQIKGESQKLLKDLSSGIDGVLDSKSGAYRKANEDFAKTIALKDQFQKMAGKDIDLFEDISSKALGLKGRRMLSNATSGVNIEKTLADADSVLGEFGVRFNDSVPQLNHMAIQLDDMFKLTRPASFQGGIERGAENVLQGQGPLRAAAGLGVEKLRELRAPDFDKKMKVLRALTKQKAK